MCENEDLESALKKSAQKLDYCASLIRNHKIEPVDENIRRIANAIADISDVLLFSKNFLNEVKEPWENRCSFCKNKQHEVTKLIQGPGVLICDKCVEICSKMLSSKEDSILPC